MVLTTVISSCILNIRASRFSVTESVFIGSILNYVLLNEVGNSHKSIQIQGRLLNVKLY